MHWPQITLLLLFAMEFGAVMVMDGKPKTGSYATHRLWITTVVLFVILALLVAGGFFK